MVDVDPDQLMTEIINEMKSTDKEFVTDVYLIDEPLSHDDHCLACGVLLTQVPPPVFVWAKPIDDQRLLAAGLCSKSCLEQKLSEYVAEHSQERVVVRWRSRA